MKSTRWANRKDREGRSVFEGGLLGLDNIGVFDRNASLPTGGCQEPADGTAWMAFFCQNMLEIARELALHDPIYEDWVFKFARDFSWIASAMGGMGENQDRFWDEEDGFFYNLVRFPDGRAARLKVRSMAGLLPLCATTVFDGEVGEKFPGFLEQRQSFLARHPETRETFAWAGDRGIHERRCLVILNEEKLRKVLQKMLDENEFLSPYGIRSLSRWPLEHPLVINVHGDKSRVSYLPAESNTGMFGGNSNWRGPIWFPINILILRALLQFHRYYGDRLTVECPTGSRNQMNLSQVAMEIGRRLSPIFLRDEKGRRPV